MKFDPSADRRGGGYVCARHLGSLRLWHGDELMPGAVRLDNHEQIKRFRIENP